MTASGERTLRDLLAGGLALPAVLAAHELGLFALLADRPCTGDEIAARLELAARPAEILLTLCRSLGLVERRGRVFVLAEPEVAGFADYWDLMLANEHRLAPSAVLAALRADAPAPSSGGDRAARRRAFTLAMHARGAASARVWPDLVDLSGARTLLDLGGGAATHAIAAARRWPALRAIVLDRPEVCETASGCVAEAGLADRIEVRAADLHDDAPLPPADLHLYSDVLHNAAPGDNERLLSRSARDLAPGGRVLVHEMLLDDDRSGPPAVAAAGLLMLLWTRGGRQYSEPELRTQLARAGLAATTSVAAGGYYTLLVAEVARG